MFSSPALIIALLPMAAIASSVPKPTYRSRRHKFLKEHDRWRKVAELLRLDHLAQALHASGSLFRLHLQGVANGLGGLFASRRNQAGHRYPIRLRRLTCG